MDNTPPPRRTLTRPAPKATARTDTPRTTPHSSTRPATRPDAPATGRNTTRSERSAPVRNTPSDRGNAFSAPRRPDGKPADGSGSYRGGASSRADSRRTPEHPSGNAAGYVTTSEARRTSLRQSSDQPRKPSDNFSTGYGRPQKRSENRPDNRSAIRPASRSADEFSGNFSGNRADGRTNTRAGDNAQDNWASNKAQRNAPSGTNNAPRNAYGNNPAPASNTPATRSNVWRSDDQPRSARPSAPPRSARPLQPAQPTVAAAIQPAPDNAGNASAIPADSPTLTSTGTRLNKRMADLGLCSRREADEWIASGWVFVNELPASTGQRVAESDRIHVDRAAYGQQEQQVTILLHKPVGYVSGQPEDGHQSAATLISNNSHWRGDTKTMRFLPSQLRGLAPAGRLDIDSTGLLVLTQDGRIARQLIGEHSTIDKEYLVRVSYTAPDGSTTSDNVQAIFPRAQLALLRHGLSLDDQPLKPAQVDWQNPEQLRFVLVEGKKRQIRRMCEAVGLKVTALKRVRIGHVRLGDLPQGQWRYLHADEGF